MKFIDTVRKATLEKGFYYYLNNAVEVCDKIGSYEYLGIVRGNRPYEVYINTKHFDHSTCNCPYAECKKLICKHMIALYFEAHPNEARLYEDKLQKYYQEMEQRLRRSEELYYKRVDDITKYVYKLSKSQLREKLINLLVEIEFFEEPDVLDSFEEYEDLNEFEEFDD